MKVLHIFNSLMPSGAETMWVAAADLLREHGIETHVLATSDSLGPYAETMQKSGFSICHIPHHKIDFVTYGFRLFLMLRKERYDAVQIHPDAWRLTNCLVAKLAGVRSVVTTLHSVFDFHGVYAVRRRLIWMVVRILGVKVVAIGATVQRNENRYGCRSTLIWNWIDFNRMNGHGGKCRRIDLGLKADAKILISVGNCSPVKNHAFLFRLLAALPKEYVLLHVGKEDPVLKEREVASELGVADRVVFLGARADVPQLLRMADVYVMSSTHEGLGLSCVEAAYAGLPCVVSNCGGLVDLAHLLPLCVAKGFEAKAFADEVVRASTLENSELTRLRTETRRKIEDVFSMEVNVAQYVDLWRRVYK